MRAVVFVLLLCACGPSVSYFAFGDSITYGTGASSKPMSYAALLVASLGLPYTNYAVSGAQAADQSATAYAAKPNGGDKVSIMVGTNDHWKYGTNAAKKDLFKAFATGIVAWLAAPQRVRGIDPGFSYAGTWTKTQAFGIGKWSRTKDDTATVKVSGTAVYVGTIMQDIVTGTADVYIDGAKVGSVSSKGAGMNTQKGATVAPAAYRFGGLANTEHTVQVKITSPSGGLNIFYLDYVAGSSQPSKPDVYLSNIIRMSAAGYAATGNTSSDQNVADYNTILSTLQSGFETDGLSVSLIDSHGALNTTTDLADGIHPSNAGHLKLKNLFFTGMTGGFSYSEVSTWIGSDGRYYIDTVNGKTLLNVP